MTAPAAPTAGAEVVVVPTARDVAVRSAEVIVAAIGAAVRERGVAHLALTGGSTSAGVFRVLASRPVRSRVDWSRVHLWWGDDRFVPRNDPLCNVWIADMTLFNPGDGAPGIPIPTEQVHPFPTSRAIEEGRDAEWCARAYADELRASLPVADGWPAFDIVLVGIGPDGHLLSVFPGSAAFDSDAWALPIPAPTHVEPRVPRVTLNPAVVSAAREVLAMVQGAAKAEILALIFAGQDGPRALPARLALRPGATWVVDRAAAARLPFTGDGGAEGADRPAERGRDGSGPDADRRPRPTTIAPSGPASQQEARVEQQWCTHLDQVRDVTPSAEGCEECLKIGATWFHLRECLVCGKVGCCDRSPNRHATAHYNETGHPLIRSFEPGETWGWCYIDEIDFELDDQPAAT